MRATRGRGRNTRVSDFIAKQVEADSFAGAETVDADKEQEKQVS